MAKKFVCLADWPIVETKQGKLRGFMLDSTYIFQGVDYAHAERFQAPKEPKSWSGVKDALSYGYVCPLLTQEKPGGEVMIPHRYWLMDEHCQNLNIWTQSLDPKAKLPVMVWLHGGGFAAGSAIEHVAYDGENMSRFGNSVVVSVNHRLNVLGYTDVSSLGEKYSNSANAGNADLVAALMWINQNIAGFGGDPENVTIFGQSGGGMKVWSLMQTPAANGLFQKGIVESGVIGGFSDSKGSGEELTDMLLKELGIAKNEPEKLEQTTYPTLAAAYLKVSARLSKEGKYVGGAPMKNDFYLGDPREYGFCEHAKTIPLMAGTVFGEFDFGPGIADKYEISEQNAKELIKKRYGGNCGEMIDLFKATYPQKALTDLLSLDSLFRAPTKDFIAKKAACPQAPTYAYLFSYEFPLNGGKTAWHCAEIPFVFHNTDIVPVCNEPGISDKLEEQIFGAFMAFGRYGNPNIPSLPEWTSCKPEDEATMIFDKECVLRHNFDNSLIELHEKLAPKFSFGGEETVLH